MLNAYRREDWYVVAVSQKQCLNALVNTKVNTMVSTQHPVCSIPHDDL